jgi:putative hydrolase of the HAD superfamily
MIIPRGYQTRIAPHPALVLFDLDNTLCDHASSLQIRLEHAFQPLFPAPAELRAAIDASVEMAVDGTRHFEELFARFGLDAPESVEEARQRYVSDRFRGLELFADAIEAIDAARRIATIGIITNGPTAIQQPKLDLLGIEASFSFALISERSGYWKPDPRLFELALARASVPAHEAIYVGDSPAHDVRGAQAAGIRSVWMNRPGLRWPGGKPPDLEVRTLKELLVSLGIESSI